MQHFVSRMRRGLISLISLML